MSANAPVNLRCEYLVNPLGIDVEKPRLSWEVNDTRRGACQTAYQVMIASSVQALSKNQPDLWDSGKVDTGQSIHVEVSAITLRSRQRCYWQVRTWDANGQPSSWSEPAWWEMGLLQREEWRGQWIGSTLSGSRWANCPCPYLRTAFTLEKPVASARLYITALGLYECSLNGSRVGEDLFTPGWTEYRKRAQYQVYDVTGQVMAGENAFGAVLGDGWYCGFLCWHGRQFYGDRPKLLAQLEIVFADGTSRIIVTDESWKVSTGPLVSSDMLMGENYDAGLEMPGWDAPGFDDAAWPQVKSFADPAIALSAKHGPTVQRIQELQPIADPVKLPGGSGWIFDLGQNMVGWVRLKVAGPKGCTVKLRFAEVLNPDGTLYTANLRAARSTDCYTLRGDGEETYEPSFTFHGFRYVELTGCDGPVTRDTVTGIVLHSNTPPTGTFSCSDDLVNQLQHNITWGQKGNFLEVPTDCPQRDERLGWMGDAQVFIRTAAFNMDVAPFFTKWQQDIADAQSAEGAYPAVVPTLDLTGGDGGPAWAEAGMICPWTVYLCYGDIRLLAAHYDSFVRFIDHQLATSQGYIRCYHGYTGFTGFGDWLATNAVTPNDLIGTAFFAYTTRLLAQVARVLGKTADVEKYEQLFQQIRQAFLDRFVTPAGVVASQTQTAYVLALYFDLLPPELRAAAGKELVQDIEVRQMHLSTGFVGAPYIPHVLTELGRLDVAYALLMQKSWPSWLYPVTQGATTIWERWDGWTHDKGFQDPGMNSFNHYAYGAIGAWLYAAVAGIELDPEHPGYKQIIIRPRPGGGLTSARATLASMYGTIVSDWQLDGDAFHLNVTIPANTQATVFLPATEVNEITEGKLPINKAEGIAFLRTENDQAVFAVTAGAYAFTVPAPKLAVV